MLQPRDHGSDLNRLVKSLETQLSDMRASLCQWQAWYLDYATLKEEVESSPCPLSDIDGGRRELARIRRDFSGEVLPAKEIHEIFGKGDLKSRDEILSVLGRRLEYVERNVDTLKGMVEHWAERLERTEIVAKPGGVDEETGLPIVDVVEELGEDGEVCGWELRKGGDVGREVGEVLRSVGFDGGGDVKRKASEEDKRKASEEEKREVSEDGKGKASEDDKRKAIEEEKRNAREDAASAGQRAPQANGTLKTAQTIAAPSTPINPLAQRAAHAQATKCILCTHDTEPEPQHVLQANPPPNTQFMTAAAQSLEDIMNSARAQQSIDLSDAVVPEDEPEDDAELRRQMLEYGMSEIGPVVAELELDDDEFGDDDKKEEDSSEDELGRSKRSPLTKNYVQRMKALERRLGVQSAFATGARSLQEDEVSVEGMGRIQVIQQPAGSTRKKAGDEAEKAAGKKDVRFAEELDIAKPKNAAFSASQAGHPAISPVGDITERIMLEPPAPERTSRFQGERAATSAAPRIPHEAPAAPSGPEGQTLSDRVVERSATSEPRNPDELDSALLYQEASVAYHRLRNRFIQREGGFMKPDTREIVPLDESEGGPRKMSRFRAARLTGK